MPKTAGWAGDRGTSPDRASLRLRYRDQNDQYAAPQQPLGCVSPRHNRAAPANQGDRSRDGSGADCKEWQPFRNNDPGLEAWWRSRNQVVREPEAEWDADQPDKRRNRPPEDRSALQARSVITRLHAASYQPSVFKVSLLLPNIEMPSAAPPRISVCRLQHVHELHVPNRSGRRQVPHLFLFSYPERPHCERHVREI